MRQRYKCLVFSLLFAVLVPQPGKAETHGNDLQVWCTHVVNNSDQASGNLCSGFINGVVEFHEALVGLGLLDGLWCKPGKVLEVVLAELILNYLKSNPDRLPLAAADTVWFAFGEHYGC